MSTETDRRLRDIALRIPAPDGLLARLVKLSTSESSPPVMQTGLVLCVGAFTVRGVPGPGTAMTQILDEQMQWLIKVNRAIALREGVDAAVWDRTAELAEDFWTAPFREYEAQEDAFDQALEERDITLTDLPDIPDDLLAAGLQAIQPRVHVTLRNAQLLGPAGAGWEDIGVMRVRLDQVAAWWTFKLAAPPEVADELD